jgi:hypothetical protein
MDIPGGAAAVGAGASSDLPIPTPIQAGTGTLFSGGLGLLGDLINGGISLWAASKQQKQADQINEERDKEYAQEYADKRSDVDFQKKETLKADSATEAANRLATQQNWATNLTNLVNKDQGTKAAFANMFKSITGRVA